MATWAQSHPESPEAAIHRTWKAYLDSKRGDISNCGAPTEFWLAAEQRSRRCYDVAASFVHPGALPTSLHIAPATADARGTYRVVTEFRAPGREGAARGWDSVLTVTWLALRDGNSWVLSGTLNHATRTWRRETVGPITYVVRPGIAFDSSRARRAVRFSDSVAAAFRVPRIESLEYYIAEDRDVVFQIVGLELPERVGPGGGFVRIEPRGGRLFSGTPAVGEDYRHELVHILLAPLTTGNTTTLASEAVATWLGGTSGLDFESAVAALALRLTTHPHVNLDALVRGSPNAAEFRPAGAVLCQLAFQHGGIEAVKRFLDIGPSIDQFQAGLESLLGQSWAAIATQWRAEVTSIAIRARRG